jgi:predicted amidohydrolase YtcJ
MKTLYRATRVRTLSHTADGEWLLVDGRHVERVGSGDPPSADRTVELPGTTIIPGFVDAHVHLTGTGLSRSGPDVSAAHSKAQLLEKLAQAARSTDGAVLVHGFDETTWDRPDLPSIDDLDGASGEPLVCVRADGHVSLANSAAISASGADGIDGTERDERGWPTGVLRREANAAAQRWFHASLSDNRIEQYQLEACALAAATGVTCVHEMAIPELRGMRDVEILLQQRGQLPVDVVVYLATTDIPLVMDLGLPRIGGDLSLDGSIGARTAHLTEPYTDADELGARYFDDDELTEFLHNAHLAGLQVGLHVIGDAAIEQAVSAWERVYHSLDSRERRHFRARRHRLEHFEMASEDAVERAANLGLAISVQPAFDATWGHPGRLYELRLGEKRGAAMNPFRTLLDRGLEVGGGSDSPVTPLDPWFGIRAVERHHDASERLSRTEALRLFTAGGARLAHLEDKKGILEPGSQADFAAYELDPMTADAGIELRPVLTVSLGREVFAI